MNNTPTASTSIPSFLRAVTLHLLDHRDAYTDTDVDTLLRRIAHIDPSIVVTVDDALDRYDEFADADFVNIDDDRDLLAALLITVYEI